MSYQLILFVHGLGGAPAATWGRFPQLLSADKALSQIPASYFSYPTSLFRLPFTRSYPRVQTLAEALRTVIDNRFQESEDITLVCHSLGGLIGKQYLIDQLELNNPLRVKRLLLYAVPNNGAGLASVAKHISWRHSQLQQLCRDSDLIRAISKDWRRCRVADRVEVRYVVAALDHLVDEHSARESWGNVTVEVLADRGHRDVVKPTGSDDLSFLILKRLVTGVAGGSAHTARQDGAPSESRRAPTGAPVGGTSDLAIAPDADVRVSISALVRIEEADRFLLVRTPRRPESFAPLGGVYKFFPEARPQLDEIEFRPQVVDADMLHDLRGFLPFKNLQVLLRWFGEGRARESAESCLRRELREESEQVGLVLEPGLNAVRFRHIRTLQEGPEPVSGETYLQYRLFDVYDLVADSEEGQALLKTLREDSHGRADLLWATSQEMIKGRASGGQLLSSTAPYLIGQRRYRAGDPGFAAP